MDSHQQFLELKRVNDKLPTSLLDLFLNIENGYSDVTLVSDDMTEFQAHKFVLGACSPVLKNLLFTNPHPHPLLFLRGVRQQELETILQIMYLGDNHTSGPYPYNSGYSERLTDACFSTRPRAK